MNTNNTFDPRELSSRKLWQLVDTASQKREGERVGERELREAIAELATRRHYLSRLQAIGKLGEQHPRN